VLAKSPKIRVIGAPLGVDNSIWKPPPGTGVL